MNFKKATKDTSLNLTLEQARHICKYFFGSESWQARPVKTSGDHILMDNGIHYQFTGSMSNKNSWDLIMQESVPLPIPKKWKV